MYYEYREDFERDWYAAFEKIEQGIKRQLTFKEQERIGAELERQMERGEMLDERAALWTAEPSYNMTTSKGRIECLADLATDLGEES